MKLISQFEYFFKLLVIPGDPSSLLGKDSLKTFGMMTAKGKRIFMSWPKTLQELP